MKTQLKVKRTYNSQFDASYINFEIEGASQNKNLNEDEVVALMTTPKYKKLCKTYLLNTLLNRIGIIHDYWFDGYEWEEATGLTDEQIFDLVYSDNLDANEEFFKLPKVKEEMDRMLKYMFNNKNIRNHEVNWFITFI